MVLTRSLSSGSLGSNRSAGSSVASSCISYKSKSGYGTDPELEDLAEALENRLRDEGRVKERSSNLLKKKIPNAFVGSEAVTILQELLQAQKDHDRKIALRLPKGSDSEEEDDEDAKNLPVTREEALDTGRRIATEFGFFKHHASSNLSLKKNPNKEEESLRTAAIKSPLNDSKSDYYQFQNNLPKHVAETKKKHKTYWDKMRLMEQEIECKDRFYFPRVWQDCFVAREAVDKLMELKLVRSRGEAVHLVRRMNQKVFCCHHVTQEHEFQDDYLFFRFVPKHERMPEPAPKPKKPNKPKRSKSPQRKKMAGARKEAQKKIREKRSRSMNHLNSDERAGGAGSLGTGSLHAPRGTGGGVYASFGTGSSSANASLNGSTSDASLSSMESFGTDSTGDMKSDNTSYGTLSQASAPLLGKDPLLDDSEEEYMESLLMPDESFANANRSSVTKAKSTGALGLAAQHKKANKKRANDIRARLAMHHKGRIDTINKKKVEMDPEKRASILAEGRKSLEKAKRELILEMPLPYHHKSVVTGKAKKEVEEKEEEKTPEPEEPQQATNEGEATHAECAASTAPAETLAKPADQQQAEPEQNEERNNSKAGHQEKKEEEQKDDGETAKAECAASTEPAETPANSEEQQQPPENQEKGGIGTAEPQPDAVPVQANGADAEGEMTALSGDSSDATNRFSQESSKDVEPINADCAPSNAPNETAQHEQQPASEQQEGDMDVSQTEQPAGVVAVQDDASEETIADLLGDSSNCNNSSPENASKNDNNFKVVVPSPPRVPVGIDC